MIYLGIFFGFIVGGSIGAVIGSVLAVAANRDKHSPAYKYELQGLSK